jgi:hypothetical protein
VSRLAVRVLGWSTFGFLLGVAAVDPELELGVRVALAVVAIAAPAAAVARARRRRGSSS